MVQEHRGEEHLAQRRRWIPKHPQAKKVNGLHAFATQTRCAGSPDSGQALSPEVELLASLYGVSNDAADELLMETLPQANGIKPKYVHSGMKHGLKLPAGHRRSTSWRPRRTSTTSTSAKDADATPQGPAGLSPARCAGGGAAPRTAAPVQPGNISASRLPRAAVAHAVQRPRVRRARNRRSRTT